MGNIGGNVPPYQDVSTRQAEDAPAPFSLRLTFEERAALEQAAGDMPLGAYIRDQVLRDGTARVDFHPILTRGGCGQNLGLV